MSEIILPRRKFLMGMAGLLAAPAIVRIESLMPVKLIKTLNIKEITQYTLDDYCEQILHPMMKRFQIDVQIGLLLQFDPVEQEFVMSDVNAKDFYI